MLLPEDVLLFYDINFSFYGHIQVDMDTYILETGSAVVYVSRDDAVRITLLTAEKSRGLFHYSYR